MYEKCAYILKIQKAAAAFLKDVNLMCQVFCLYVGQTFQKKILSTVYAFFVKRRRKSEIAVGPKLLEIEIQVRGILFLICQLYI